MRNVKKINFSRYRRIETIKKWLGILSISRIIRWSIYMMVCGWTYLNWHESIPRTTAIERFSGQNSHFIDVDGMSVHYRQAGSGTPLILLHDANNSSISWLGWLDSLSQKNKVIAVDLPGFGLTGSHPLGSYSAFMYASFIDSLAQKLSIEKFNLAGNGLGAQIAWHYAAETTNTGLQHLILIAAPGFEKQSSNPLMWMARTPVVNRVLWKITPRAYIRLMMEDVFAHDSLATDERVDRHFNLLCMEGNRKAFTDRSSVSENRPPVDLVEKIKQPVLILWGAEDTRISPQHAYDFHRKIRGSALKIYRDTGHWPQEENPYATARDVQAFLEDRF